MLRKTPRMCMAAIAVWFMVGSANAALFTVSATAPAIDGEDIANLGPSSGTDKWWNDAATSGRPKGQTFTTGNTAVTLNALTLEVTETQSAEPTKTYVVRISTVDRVDPNDSSTWVLTEIYSETATQEVQWIGATKAADQGVDAYPFATWTLETPLALDANTEYGIDVGMTATTSGWQTGIPYIKRSGDQYAGGTRYMSGTTGLGVGDTTMNNVSGDLIFHLDMTTVPEPATLALMGLGGLVIARRRHA